MRLVPAHPSNENVSTTNISHLTFLTHRNQLCAPIGENSRFQHAPDSDDHCVYALRDGATEQGHGEAKNQIALDHLGIIPAVRRQPNPQERMLWERFRDRAGQAVHGGSAALQQ